MVDNGTQRPFHIHFFLLKRILEAAEEFRDLFSLLGGLRLSGQ
jgi:hypothetical protein